MHLIKHFAWLCSYDEFERIGEHLRGIDQQVQKQVPGASLKSPTLHDSGKSAATNPKLNDRLKIGHSI